MMDKILNDTGMEIVFRITSSGYSSEIAHQKLRFLEQTASRVQNTLAEIRFLQRSSESTYNNVQLLEDFSFCPVLIGNDQHPIFLSNFIEVVDELLDYDKIKGEFPTLSFAQIHGAIEFLKKISQFNSKGIDIEDFEDSVISENEELIQALKAAIANQETTRVLNRGEYNCGSAIVRP